MKPLPCMNPFQPKRAPPRKAVRLSSLQMDAAERAREFGLDYHSAHFELEDNFKFYFKIEEAEWVNDLTGESYRTEKKKPVKAEKQVSSREIQKFQEKTDQLQDENNTLKCKNEILIDMIAEVYSEFKLENDVNKKDNNK